MQILGQALDTFKQQLERNAPNIHLHTGFKSLDQLISGYIHGEMTVVAGRPGMGVTSFLLESAVNMAQQYGYRGAYISVDHAEQIIQAKLMSILTNVPVNYLLDVKYHKESLKKLRLTDDQASIPLYIHCQSNRLLENLLNEIMMLHTQHALEFVMIDSIQNIILSDRKQFRSQFDHFNEMLFQLTTFCRENKIALICGSRLSRKVEDRGGDKKPNMADISMSSMIEEKAEKVLFLYRPEYYGIEYDDNRTPVKGIMQVIVAKNLTGPSGEITLFAGEHKQHPFRVVDPESEHAFLKKFIYKEKEQDDDEDDPPF